MCGRFTLHSQLNLLLQQFAIDAGPEWAPRYNIAPTQRSLVVRESIEGGRELVPLRWGLVPSWAKDPSIGQRMINARAETLAEKPSFRTAFKRRRCLVPANGYYEWERTGQGKQAHYIRPRSGELLAMAGLWESWHVDQPDAMETFTIITTDANETTRHIHDRMPVFLQPEHYDLWLDPEFEATPPLQDLLQPAPTDLLQFHRVSSLVNNPRHESPECITPQGATDPN